MKLVEFTRDMAPHVAGESRLVPDPLAEILAREGTVTNIRPWPAELPADEPSNSRVPRVKRPRGPE